jgi:endonuclease/exonuclease/phosphatase (EEP) superfamily protein YafD
VTGKRLTVGALNCSVAAAKHHPDRLLADLTALMRDCDVVLMEEAGQAGHIVEQAAKAAGMGAWFGSGKPGQASTPVAITNRAGLVWFEATALTRKGLFVGKGAGPDHAKAKWLMAAMFELDGEQYAVGCVHLTASQQFSLRALAAMMQARRAANALRKHHGRHRVLGGDLNAIPGARTLRPLRRFLRSTQKRLGIKATHGHRSIDDVYIDKTLRAVSHETRETVSDHRAYVVVLESKEHR